MRENGVWLQQVIAKHRRKFVVARERAKGGGTEIILESKWSVYHNVLRAEVK